MYKIATSAAQLTNIPNQFTVAATFVRSDAGITFSLHNAVAHCLVHKFLFIKLSRQDKLMQKSL